MMDFFGKSKKRAKKRLTSCIETDRNAVLISTVEKIRSEFEEAVKKYAELDGHADIEISKENYNRTYITAAVYLKGTRL